MTNPIKKTVPKPKGPKTFGLGTPEKYPTRIVPKYKAVIYQDGQKSIIKYSIDGKSSVSQNIDSERGLGALQRFLIAEYGNIPNVRMLIFENTSDIQQPILYIYQNGLFQNYKKKEADTLKAHQYRAWCLPMANAQLGQLKKNQNGSVILFPNCDATANSQEQFKSLVSQCEKAIKAGLRSSKFNIYKSVPNAEKDLLVGYFTAQGVFCLCV